METLPRDLIYSIFHLLTRNDIIQLTCVNRHLAQFGQEENIKLKREHRFKRIRYVCATSDDSDSTQLGWIKTVSIRCFMFNFMFYNHNFDGSFPHTGTDTIEYILHHNQIDLNNPKLLKEILQLPIGWRVSARLIELIVSHPKISEKSRTIFEQVLLDSYLGFGYRRNNINTRQLNEICKYRHEFDINRLKTVIDNLIQLGVFKFAKLLTQKLLYYDIC